MNPMKPIALIGSICLIGLIVVVSYFYFTDFEPKEPPAEMGVVAEAVDDLTFRLESGHRIRYIGLEAPEKGKCFSGKSREGNINLIGKEVRLEIEPILERSEDGAWTRYVWVREGPEMRTPDVLRTSGVQGDEPEEILINNRIIEMGLAFPLLSQDMEHYDMMTSSAQYASATKKGLWGQCEVYNDEETGRLRVK